MNRYVPALALAACFFVTGDAVVKTQAQDKKPAFDAKSAQATAEWLSEMWKPVREAAKGKNIAGRRAFEAAIVDAVKAKQGSKIDWEMPVFDVTKKGIRFKLTTKIGGEPCELMLLPASAKNPSYVTPFPVPMKDADWTLKLKSGDLVRVQGEVTGARGLGSIGNFGVVIANPVISQELKKR